MATPAPSHVNSAPATIAPGIYGNVRVSRETGDLGGIELEIGGTGTVETVLCEGWCNQTYTCAYREHDGIVSYEVREALRDSEGQTSVNIYAVELKPKGKHILAKVTGDGDWSVLKRLSRPFGLQVARDNQVSEAK